MQIDPRNPLNYASPAVEQARAGIDLERVKQVEHYKQATFGERRPIINTVMRLIVMLGILVIFCILLPHHIFDLLGAGCVFAYICWERHSSR